jgi:MATE family multidrug resistance protein
MGQDTWRDRWRREGGAGELIRIALPLILSNSFWTIQVTLDRVFLSWHSGDAVAAAMPAVLLFWTPFILLQNTANYATTFVAQYFGAGRKERVGQTIWQAVYFSVLAGLGFLALIPLSDHIVNLGDHAPEIKRLEVIYFDCLCHSALPALLVAAVTSFFAGRGDSWTVLFINAVGTAVNGVLDYAWIFGHWGFPEAGIAGAGWATVAGAWASALTGFVLMFRAHFRQEYATVSGWRPDPALFARLLRFGLPNGAQWALDLLAFTVFTFLIGNLGKVELAATNIAFTINMLAVLPMLGIGQATGVLVGQRLGQDRPNVAEKTTWCAFRIAWLYLIGVAAVYLFLPELFLWLFHRDDAGESWTAIAGLATVLLRFVAVYTLFDGWNIVFSFALRGAGDTRFVTLVSLVISWPLMVVPTWLAWRYDWGLYWCWAFASAYIIMLAFTFLLRFRTGKWKTMRVIEAAPPAETEPGGRPSPDSADAGVCPVNSAT